MKRISFLVFGLIALVYIASSEAVPVFPASEIWFPENVSKWTFQSVETLEADWKQDRWLPVEVEVGKPIDLWLGRDEADGKVYTIIYEAGGVLFSEPDSPFLRFRIDDRGNIVGLANLANQFLLETEIEAEKAIGGTVVEIERLRKTFKFSSDEWLLLPGRLESGQKWIVVSWQFTNVFDVNDRREIEAKFWASTPPPPNTVFVWEQNWNWEQYFSVSYRDVRTNTQLWSFTLKPNVGITEVFADGVRCARLLSISKSQPVKIEGKMTTTWGSIKAQ